MIRSITPFFVLAALTACGDGQPLYEEEVVQETVEEDLPPGTEDPTASSGIIRFEAENDKGGGLVTVASYDEDADVFNVDYLAFDGANVYQRGVAVPTLGGYPVYDADDTTPDFLTAAPVFQIVPYRAIVARSPVDVEIERDGELVSVPRSSFSIIRTGGYDTVGFGGFIYERNGPVTLPETGQAQWDGKYAGIRTFQPTGGFEFTEGDAIMSIDLEDFNLNDGVQGIMFNRVRYDADGVELNPIAPDGFPYLPNLPFVVAYNVETVLDTGEFAGEIRNSRIDKTGRLTTYEDGTYSGIIAGDTTTGDGGEVVGIFVVESEDPIVEDLFVQETGGFILQRSN